ncbi:MAG: hypothetical protein ACK5N8_05900 [Alphaproteobacteria bacterium]
MYFIELIYTNGKSVRLPEPYILWLEARETLNRYVGKAQYTAIIVND